MPTLLGRGATTSDVGLGDAVALRCSDEAVRDTAAADEGLAGGGEPAAEGEVLVEATVPDAVPDADWGLPGPAVVLVVVVVAAAAVELGGRLWQCTQCRHTLQWPSRLASTARSLSAGPSRIFIWVRRCSSVSSGSADPSIRWSRNAWRHTNTVPLADSHLGKPGQASLARGNGSRASAGNAGPHVLAAERNGPARKQQKCAGQGSLRNLLYRD